MTGVATLQNQFNLNALELTTNTISSNATVTFPIESGNANVDTLNLFPSDAEQPKEGRLVLIRIHVVSGSTDTDIRIFQDESATSINQVSEITNAGTGDTPDSFILGQGTGVPFLNKDGDNLFHIEISENSSNDSVYEIELQWFNFS